MDAALSVFKRIGKGIESRFTINEHNMGLYKDLIKYFHGDDSFVGELTKGILLMGPTGTGKTLAMKIMSVYRQIDDIKFMFNRKLYRMNFEIISANDIVTAFVNNGFEGIDQYCTRYILCIDDIGSESDRVRHYGNTIDVVSYILSERYSRRLLTLGTTNFPLTTLEQMYDDRIMSRMYALFNFMTLKGQDFRKQK